MSVISRMVRKVILKKYIPEFVFALYFKRLNAGKKAMLKAKINSGADLLDGMADDVKAHWQMRIKDVMDCEDNRYIPRHNHAGEIQNGHLIMHNGLRIDPLSYYNYPLLKMLMDNRGVHEPQEERVFGEVLNDLAGKAPSTLVELGSYWAFYSMWFKNAFPSARTIAVEPNRLNLSYGKLNFKLNGMHGEFINAGIGDKLDTRSNVTTLEQICTARKIGFIDILHADIQGYEFDMLKGSRRLLAEKKIGYLFISTHSNALHESCRAMLEKDYGYAPVADANLDETYSWDGILVMKSPEYPGLEYVEVSKKTSDTK